MKPSNILIASVLACSGALALSPSARAQMTNTLPATYVYPVSAANTNQPGFIWRISQVNAADPGSLPWAESQLAGEQGANLADPAMIYGSAAAAGAVPSDPNLPVTFAIPGVINMSIAGNSGSTDCSHNRADLPCEDGMVGTPGGAGNGTDNLAAEALTYLSLPQGLTTIGVRSDDGFQLQIGAANPGDRYSTNAVVVTSYPGTRGAGDNTVTLNVPKAGLYAARLLYDNGGGDASVEWYTFPTTGTNAVTGTPNGGTNAVLIGDLASGGIHAYRSITSAPLGSYVSSLIPTPGATGIPVAPTVTATIVNGAVPVTGITLTIDGSVVTPTITTTTNGATISYTASNPLPNLATHTILLTWNDNGTTLGVNAPFTAQSYVALDPAQIVTPDTTKPGFKFNIFANSTDPLMSTVNGLQGGESDNLDNIELGLNGLEPDGSGGFLPNKVDITKNGAAMAAAPALGGPNAPAEFVITNTLNLSAANMPGFPATDGGADPSHSEVLTYVNIPVGLTTFTLNLAGFYRAYAGSWDYLAGTQAGSLNNAAAGPTSFSVLATKAGYYPIRITAFNLDGAPQMSLYTIGSHGTNVLVNDVANGGLAASYALSTPSGPYVRYVSPRPVPRQVSRPNDRVLVRLQDGANKVSDSTAAFNLDGNNVTTTNNRVGDVLELMWKATTLQTPAEIHTGKLTYKDSAGNSLSNQWTFLNLKAVWLPTMTPGSWIPTNAIAVETFQEYTNPTVFTNDTPTTNWYLSPQPENPLVDVAPIFTNTPAGPKGWYVWNWDHPSGTAGFDVTAPDSDAYLNFLCVDLTTFSGIEGDSLNTAPGEMINGIPLTQLVADPNQNVLIAESDNRSGSTIQGQTQFAMSKSFDLSAVANPVIAFASIQKQNQDSINAMEYSVDGGATWAPIIYYLDGHSLGSDPADVQVNADTTVNVINTLFHDTNPGEVPTWTDSTGDVNNTYASGIGAPISAALAPFFAPRINDDKFDGKRLEVVRMPLASHKSNVRLRLSQIGTCSWYFGVANIAIYDVPLSGAIVPTGLPSTTPTAPTLSLTRSGNKLTLSWPASVTGYHLESTPSLTGATWTAVSGVVSNSVTVTIGAGNQFYRLITP